MNGTIEMGVQDFKLRGFKSIAPDFRLYKEIPKGMAPQIEAAVKDFIETSHVPQGIDKQGFYYQTLQTIASITVQGGIGDLWLGIRNGELLAYVIGGVTTDFDGKLSYMVSQGWVKKHQRGERWVKDCWNMIRQRAKDAFCSHFAVMSTRGNDKAYCRFLGKGFHFYSSVLKAEI